MAGKLLKKDFHVDEYEFIMFKKMLFPIMLRQIAEE